MEEYRLQQDASNLALAEDVPPKVEFSFVESVILNIPLYRDASPLNEPE